MGLKDKLETLKASGGEVDWSKVTADWQTAVGALVGQVRDWLAEYEAGGLLTLYDESRMLMEEQMPVYEVPCLKIETPSPDLVLFLEPVARVVFGAQGRVDLYRAGDKDNGFMLLRTSTEEGTDSWSVRRDYGPKGILSRPLEKEVLEEILATWLP